MANKSNPYPCAATLAPAAPPRNEACECIDGVVRAPFGRSVHDGFEQGSELGHGRRLDHDHREPPLPSAGVFRLTAGDEPFR
jgi:hypothetical protein